MTEGQRERLGAHRALGRDLDIEGGTVELGDTRSHRCTRVRGLNDRPNDSVGDLGKWDDKVVAIDLSGFSLSSDPEP